MRKGQLRVGSNVVASVESERRRLTALNHSATHLLHAALRRVLGTHVQQKGSLVSPEHLRFDFSHSLPVTETELREVESIVNREIQQNTPVQTELLAYQDAIDERRHGAVRREVRRSRSGADDGRWLFGRTVRRHARAAHRRHRPAAHRIGERHCRRRATHRGVDRTGGARVHRSRRARFARHRGTVESVAPRRGRQSESVVVAAPRPAARNRSAEAARRGVARRRSGGNGA